MVFVWWTNRLGSFPVFWPLGGSCWFCFRGCIEVSLCPWWFIGLFFRYHVCLRSPFSRSECLKLVYIFICSGVKTWIHIIKPITVQVDSHSSGIKFPPSFILLHNCCFFIIPAIHKLNSVFCFDSNIMRSDGTEIKCWSIWAYLEQRRQPHSRQ